MYLNFVFVYYLKIEIIDLVFIFLYVLFIKKEIRIDIFFEFIRF